MEENDILDSHIGTEGSKASGSRVDETECYEGQFRDGDRVYVDRPLPEIIEAENAAVISIVLGTISDVLSVFVVGFIMAIFAIINSKKAKQVLNSRHHKYHVATAGEIFGWVSIALSAFFLAFWIIQIIMIVTIANY